MSLCTLPPELSGWIAHLATALAPRVQARLAVLLAGLLFARGRRTVTGWLRAAGVGRGYRRCYYFLTSAGRRADAPGRAPAVGRARGKENKRKTEKENRTQLLCRKARTLSRAGLSKLGEHVNQIPQARG
jgi:hypothetical protein